MVKLEAFGDRMAVGLQKQGSKNLNWKVYTLVISGTQVTKKKLLSCTCQDLVIGKRFIYGLDYMAKQVKIIDASGVSNCSSVRKVHDFGSLNIPTAFEKNNDDLRLFSFRAVGGGLGIAMTTRSPRNNKVLLKKVIIQVSDKMDLKVKDAEFELSGLTAMFKRVSYNCFVYCYGSNQGLLDNYGKLTLI